MKRGGVGKAEALGKILEMEEPSPLKESGPELSGKEINTRFCMENGDTIACTNLKVLSVSQNRATKISQHQSSKFHI